MCGITGFIDFNQRSTLENLSAMAGTLEHRGPDDDGNEIFALTEATIGFGFRRLSIIDLSETGHQPMHSHNAQLTIVFNGEIYNHAEIRKTLEEKGHHFKSHSDTEVILNAYLEWDLDCVHHFTGMFAIALFDRKKNKVFLLRDRAGVKPLFYYHHEGLILFASELKAFHRHPHFKKALNLSSVALYFQHGYVPAPHCIFENTYKLLPGHWATLDLKHKNISIKKYWDVTDYYNQPRLPISFEDAITETEKILKKACEYRMVADVPVGIFLSGGYDSSLVTALLQHGRTQKLKTFTIGFAEEAFNEASYAKKVAQHLGTDHHEYTCTYKEAADIIPMLPEMYDEPFADSSAIPTYLVSKMAKQHVTVALSADGGDETFAGYTKYVKAGSYIQKLKQTPGPIKKLVAWQASLLNAVKKTNNLGVPDRLDKLQQILRSTHPVTSFNIITQAMTQKEVSKLMVNAESFPPTAFEKYSDLKAHSFLDAFLWADYKTFLADDILQKVDRATMAVSLEGREPLLDHHLIEWAALLPANYKLHNGKGKHILREITHRYLPKEMMDRGKMGFQIPLEQWLRNEQKEILQEYTSRKKIKNAGVLNYHKVEEITNAYLTQNPKVDFHRVWKILMLQMWFEKWMS